MPIIAGHDPAYFKKQIQDYAAGQAAVARDGALRQDGAASWAWTRSRGYFAGQKRAAHADHGRRPPRWSAGGPRPPSAWSATARTARAIPPSSIPNLDGQPPGYLREQMLLFKADKRSPGDPALAALKALMRTIPDETFTDLAAYYSSLR